MRHAALAEMQRQKACPSRATPAAESYQNLDNKMAFRHNAKVCAHLEWAQIAEA
jgi:hypothetical protein